MNMTITARNNKDWWKDAVVYQVYIRSFMDSNADGVGDIPGLISRLDHIRDLGVDLLWLSPFCVSPNDDNGYDVSDYMDIMPEFGTLADFDRLAAECDKRGIGLMMDLVLNHTSDRHPWFVESRASRDNPKRDWYHWADGVTVGKGEGAGPAREELPPNNWQSYFGGPAWTKDDATGQWYVHHFLKSQPDLNWENPEVRQEMYRICRFWLDRGVKAFRLDAVHHIGKPFGYPDAEPVPEPWHKLNYTNTEETHRHLREMHEEVFGPRGAFTVGETGGTTPKSARLYVDRARRELDMIFHFSHVFRKPHDMGEYARIFSDWYRHLSNGGWDAQFFTNHDLPRAVSALGDDGAFRAKSAMTIATALLTSWGTPYIYQGDEIGMRNAGFGSLEEFRDIAGLRDYREALERGTDPAEAWAYMTNRCRDNSRTPLSWDGSVYGGFSTVAPWIGNNADYASVNVAADRAGADSVFAWHRALIDLRRANQVFRRGDIRYLRGNPRVLAYERHLQEKAGLVILNWSGEDTVFPLPGGVRRRLLGARLAAANYPGRLDKANAALGGFDTIREWPEPIRLRPWEAVVYSIG